MGASSGGDAGAIPLTDIILSSYEIPERFLPDWLLGGSAPRLRLFQLNSISLPALLLSATHLVHLRLHGISSSGYISPKEMVTCLSTLAGLESLLLEERCAHAGKRAGGILRFGRGLWANARGCSGSKYMHYILENGSTNGRNYSMTLKMGLGYKALERVNRAARARFATTFPWILVLRLSC